MIDEYGNEITWYPSISHNTKSIAKEIAQRLENDILNGTLKSGFKLPPQRVLANFLKINHSTITRAYKICEAKGLIKGSIGKGTFVSADAGIPQNLLHPDNSQVIDMGMVLPLYEVNPLIEHCLKQVHNNMDYDNILTYVPPEGTAKHRYIAAKWLERFEIKAKPERIIITAGTQNALSVILTSLFKKGDRIVVDKYTYTGFKSLSNLLGIILRPVDFDKDGIDIDELEEICSNENIAGIYLMPDCHNPTSLSLSDKQRMRIAQIAKAYDLLLIEDSYYAFTAQVKHKPISYYIPERSFYIAGFSKSINPSFRISYLAAPGRYVRKLILGMNNLTWMASPINAEIISQMIRFNYYDTIIAEKLLRIKSRNTLVNTVLSEYNLQPNDHSFFRYLQLPNNFTGKEFEMECIKKGVQVFSLERFSVNTRQVENGVRLSVSAPKTIQELEAGLLIIKSILDSAKTEPPLIL